MHWARPHRNTSNMWGHWATCHQLVDCQNFRPLYFEPDPKGIFKIVGDIAKCEHFTRLCYCFNTTSTHEKSCLRNDIFPIRVTELVRLLSWKRWGGGRGLGGVVVGVWVEWWSGFGWSGGRGLGGVVWLSEMGWGDGWGCGECWSGGVASVESHMLVVRGIR